MTLKLLDEPTHLVAIAVAFELKKLDWPADVVLRHVTVPELDAEDLGKETHVLIGGDATDAERSSRGATAEQLKIAIGVRARCKPDDTPRFQRLQSVAYTVTRKILQLDKHVIRATPTIVQTNLSHDVDRLRKGEFLTIRTAEFTSQRRFAQ